jgi:TetR/AcrR family transcriptional regulator, transcriptional repressor for nem operon
MNNTKDYIIKSTCILFLQKNYKEVTLQEIVKKTGLSKGAFYHHFETKEKLFLEVLHFFMDWSIHSYEKYSQNSFLQFYNDYIIETVELNNKYIHILNQYSETQIDFQINFFAMMFDALKMFPEFKNSAVKGFNSEIVYWINAIKRGKESGELKSDISEKEFGELFLYLSDGVGLHMIIRDQTINETVSQIKSKWDSIYQYIKI